MDKIEELRKLFAVWDTYHDFKNGPRVKLNIKGKELLKLVSNVIPEHSRKLCDDIILKYTTLTNTTKMIGKNVSFVEAEVIQDVIDNSSLKELLKIEVKNKYPKTGEEFQNLREGVFDTENLIFVPDANLLGDKTLCFNAKEYRGYFDNIDAKVISNSSRDDNNPCFGREFQTYGIYKHDGSLFEYESVVADYTQQKVIFKHANWVNTIDILKDNKIEGVTKFIDVLVKTQRHESLDETIFENVKNVFGLDYSQFSETEELNIQYLRCLMDIKRSGDYMTVEAAKQANANAGRPNDTRYVFVSTDSFAIMRAILSGVPSIRAYHSGRYEITAFYNFSKEGRTLFGLNNKTQTTQTSDVKQLTDQQKLELLSAVNNPKGKHLTSILKDHSRRLNIPVYSLNTSIHNDPKLNASARKKPLKIVEQSRRDQSVVKGGMLSNRFRQVSNIYPSSSRYKTNVHPISHHSRHSRKPESFLDTEFDVYEIMQEFHESHPFYKLLSYLNHYYIQKISVFQYILYRFICHYSE
jgi:hypothetical protein